MFCFAVYMTNFCMELFNCKISVIASLISKLAYLLLSVHFSHSCLYKNPGFCFMRLVLFCFLGTEKLHFYKCTNFCLQLHKYFYNCTICAQLHIKKPWQNLQNNRSSCESGAAVKRTVLGKELVVTYRRREASSRHTRTCSVWRQCQHTTRQYIVTISLLTGPYFKRKSVEINSIKWVN